MLAKRRLSAIVLVLLVLLVLVAFGVWVVAGNPIPFAFAYPAAWSVLLSRETPDRYNAKLPSQPKPRG